MEFTFTAIYCIFTATAKAFLDGCVSLAATKARSFPLLVSPGGEI